MKINTSRDPDMTDAEYIDFLRRIVRVEKGRTSTNPLRQRLTGKQEQPCRELAMRRGGEA